jgi:hypothetical protein
VIRVSLVKQYEFFENGFIDSINNTLTDYTMTLTAVQVTNLTAFTPDVLGAQTNVFDISYHATSNE